MKANAAQLLPLRPDIRLYLFHGPDEAGASDLARRIAAALGPDVERVDLDGATLRKDPARLVDEAMSLSLFGGARLIRVAPVGEESLDAVASLLAANRGGSPVVAIAPAVKATARLVKLALGSPRALVVGCYVPTGAEAERLVAAALVDHGLRAAPGVARRLVQATGADRAVMLREIEKLALYVDADAERPREVGHPELDAIGADLDEAEQSRLVASLVEGRSADLGGQLARWEEGGGSPVPWLRALARRLIALADIRGAVDAGEPVETVMKRHRIFFRDEAETARAVRRWHPAMLAAALARVRAAERAAVAPAYPGGVVADADALAIARGVERRG